MHLKGLAEQKIYIYTMSDSGLIAVMVILECLEVGLNTVTKGAMRKGMSYFVSIVYSNALSVFFLVPCSLIYYRKRTLPRFTFSIFWRIFLLGLLSCSCQMFLYSGIGRSSPTLASAMNDLTPAFTFILAIIFRMEMLNLRVQSCQAKSIGTMVSITGALIVTLYKGLPIILQSPLPKNILRLHSSQSNWVLGGFLLAASSLSLALWYIVQTWIIKDYPAVLMGLLILSVVITIQSAIVALIAENDVNAWRLSLDIEWIVIFYTTIFAFEFRSVVHTWALHQKGPVFVSMFKPLGMVIAVLMGVSFLGDTLYLGSVIGAGTIALGFYGVIWGQAQEEKMVEETKTSIIHSSATRVPLLQNTSMEI